MDGFAPWKNRSVLALNAQYSQTGEVAYKWNRQTNIPNVLFYESEVLNSFFQ